jgi:hypothetical protein
MGSWTLETQARIIGALTEGNAIRGAARMGKHDKNAVLDLAYRVGDGCGYLHNRYVRAVRALIIEGDETWSFIYKKQSRLSPDDPAEWGDAYTYIGLDAIAKLVISYLVGKRDEESADIFAGDLRARLVMVPHLSTDGFNAYPAVIAKHFLCQPRQRRGRRSRWPAPPLRPRPPHRRLRRRKVAGPSSFTAAFRVRFAAFHRLSASGRTPTALGPTARGDNRRSTPATEVAGPRRAL